MIDKSRIYTTLTMVFAFLQTFLPTLKFDDLTNQIITTVLLTFVSIFTILKQRVSVEIDSKATWLTWILISIAALGGLNEMLGFVHLDAIWQTRMRDIVTALIGILNIVSKQLFPSDAGKQIQAMKVQLKNSKS